MAPRPPKPPTALGARAFRVAFSLYLVVAVLITAALVAEEYYGARDDLMRELGIYESTFAEPLGNALWALDLGEVSSIVEGMVEIPQIRGARVLDHRGMTLFAAAGLYERPGSEGGGEADADLIAHRFEIHHAHETGAELVGVATLYSSAGVAFERVQARIVLILLAAVLKTLALWLIFLWVSERMISRPIRTLTEKARTLDVESPGPAPFSPRPKDETELVYLFDALNRMGERLGEYAEEQVRDKAELRARGEELARLNASLEEQVRKRTKDLAEAHEDLRHFVYISSHDLREPLRAVTMFLSLLKKKHGDNLDDESREYVGYAVEAASRMNKLILDLLDYSRVSTRQIEHAPVRLEACVEEAITHLSASIAEAGAEIDVTTDLPVIGGDQDQLTTLFENLIGNAVKYRAEERSPEIRISAEFSETDVIIAVSDNGIGIESPYFDRIFGVFERLHGVGQYEGTGIGLAIGKRVVERHGGQIWVESQPGEGSTFYCSFPLAESERPAA